MTPRGGPPSRGTWVCARRRRTRRSVRGCRPWRRGCGAQRTASRGCSSCATASTSGMLSWTARRSRAVLLRKSRVTAGTRGPVGRRGKSRSTGTIMRWTAFGISAFSWTAGRGRQVSPARAVTTASTRSSTRSVDEPATRARTSRAWRQVRQPRPPLPDLPSLGAARRRSGRGGVPAPGTANRRRTRAAWAGRGEVNRGRLARDRGDLLLWGMGPTAGAGANRGGLNLLGLKTAEVVIEWRVAGRAVTLPATLHTQPRKAAEHAPAFYLVRARL